MTWNFVVTAYIKKLIQLLTLKSTAISIQSKLQQRILESNFRELKFHEGLIDFCSNDYLGLASRLKGPSGHSSATGSGGSRLLAGNYRSIEALEQSIAGFHNAESGLVFNSGYD